MLIADQSDQKKIYTQGRRKKRPRVQRMYEIRKLIDRSDTTYLTLNLRLKLGGK